MYKAYLLEREGKEVYQNDYGFIIYKIDTFECYIVDIYVRPEWRKQRVASDMADDVAAIAKDRGCTHMTGSVDLRLPSATVSMQVLLAYGMTFHTMVENGLFFIKNI